MTIASLRIRRPARALPIAALLVLSSITALAQAAQPDLVPISRDEVWRAVTGELLRRGVPAPALLGAEEIDLPVAVPAPPNRSLRVSMVCWDADRQRAQFQLECRQPGQCVPFLAYADAAQSTVMGSQRIAGSSCRNTYAAHAPASPSRKDLVRVGDRATVVFHGLLMNLTTLVTCLERGPEGAIVRVRNQDGQVFRARVTAPARLDALPSSVTEAK